MKIYMDFSVASGIDAYDYGKSWISVQFKDGAVYKYTNAGAGEKNIEVMKSRALLGKGLKVFINENAGQLHPDRIR